MNPIDCHILLDPDRTRFHTGCLASLINEPVNIHILPAIMGDIGAGRMAGFRIGSAPYISFVDDDDKVLPGAYQLCLDALARNPTAIGAYSDEILIDEEGKKIGQSRHAHLDWTFERQITMIPFVHHGVVMRREAVLQVLPELARWRFRHTEQVLFGLLAMVGPWVRVPVEGYAWRRHSTQDTNQTGRTPDLKEVIRYLAQARLRL